jgi:energy-coupling factor transporter ATP-binding protein EcfA2
MNSALMGLSRKEVDARFDAIASFADIGEFIDQPVKTYSSGMYVRLAFAAAINVDPDILVVDEALAVGDIAFRNKCMVHINGLRDRGTTVLFVSHDLSTLQLICNRVVWLENGQVRSVGEPVRICQEFYVFMTGTAAEGLERHEKMIAQQETGVAKFIEFSLDRTASERGSMYDVGDDIGFSFSLRAREMLGPIVFAVSIYRTDGDWLVGMTSREKGVLWPGASAGEVRRGTLVLSPNCFSPGDYTAALGAYSEDLSLCYALTELSVMFSVRSDFPTWGKFLHPCRWVKMGDGNVSG